MMQNGHCAIFQGKHELTAANVSILPTTKLKLPFDSVTQHNKKT